MSTDPIHGRGAQLNVPNRFERTRVEADWEQWETADELPPEPGRGKTQFLPDASQSILSENDSPDIGFRWSINAYRGCEHGCAYCYARPYHEYLGMSAGLDFETKILVKFDAPELLRKELAAKNWQPETIVMSGVTDCYQPGERQFRLTRGLLEVLLEARHPCGLITKNALVCRDLDLLAQLAERNLVGVNISVTTLDAKLARVLEPRTSSPTARLRAIRALTDAGVPVRAMVAPIIPGLNDFHAPEVLAAVAEAGAITANYTMLRLPLTVLPVFTAWLDAHAPEHKDRVLGHVRAVRGGKLYDSNWGDRMRGTGEYAAGIKQTFGVFRAKYGLDRKMPVLDFTQFVPPTVAGAQKFLF